MDMLYGMYILLGVMHGFGKLSLPKVYMLVNTQNGFDILSYPCTGIVIYYSILGNAK